MLRTSLLAAGSCSSVRNGGTLRSSFPVGLQTMVSAWSGQTRSCGAGGVPRPRDVPRGPVTVTVLLGVCLYVVKSLTMYGSPILSSTPGGMEIGVRPSFEGLAVDAENCRRAAGAGAQFWKAGTRKEGSVTTNEGATALALLGASIGGLATGCGGGRLHGAPIAFDEAERDSGPWALSSKIAAGCLRKPAGTTRGLDCSPRQALCRYQMNMSSRSQIDSTLAVRTSKMDDNSSAKIEYSPGPCSLGGSSQDSGGTRSGRTISRSSESNRLIRLTVFI